MCLEGLLGRGLHGYWCNGDITGGWTWGEAGAGSVQGMHPVWGRRGVERLGWGSKAIKSLNASHFPLGPSTGHPGLARLRPMTVPVRVLLFRVRVNPRVRRRVQFSPHICCRNVDSVCDLVQCVSLENAGNRPVLPIISWSSGIARMSVINIQDTQILQVVLFFHISGLHSLETRAKIS